MAATFDVKELKHRRARVVEDTRFRGSTFRPSTPLEFTNLHM